MASQDPLLEDFTGVYRATVLALSVSTYSVSMVAIGEVLPLKPLFAENLGKPRFFPYIKLNFPKSSTSVARTCFPPVGISFYAFLASLTP